MTMTKNMILAVVVLVSATAPAAPSSHRTEFLATAFINTRDCGAGANDFISEHSALVVDVAPGDSGREWTLLGEQWECPADVFIPGQLIRNSARGILDITWELEVSTRITRHCREPRVYARSFAGVNGGSGASRTRISLCKACRHEDDDWEF